METEGLAWCHKRTLQVLGLLSEADGAVLRLYNVAFLLIFRAITKHDIPYKSVGANK